MQRVLQVVNIMDRGGVETLLMNIYRKIDRDSIQFDFLTHPYSQDYSYEYESEILSMGGRIYKAPSFSHNPCGYRKYIKVFFQNHPEYSVVHAHNLDSASLVYMREAKKTGRYLIAHSHNTEDHGKIIKRIMLRGCHHIIRQYPDYFYACSLPAAKFAFGKRIAESSSCQIFHNGIDVDQYFVDNALHLEMRNRLFPDARGPVFGTVGRLLPQKNQSFLLDVFADILKRDSLSELAIVGKGELRPSLEAKAKDLGIERHVHFIGSVSNVPDYLKAFDVFLLPSLYEGLPLVSIEAQASGLPTVVSNGVPPMAKCSDLIRFVDLSEGTSGWADAALEAYQKGRDQRVDRIEQVRAAGFDISEISKRLCEFYKNHEDMI